MPPIPPPPPPPHVAHDCAARKRVIRHRDRARCSRVGFMAEIIVFQQQRLMLTMVNFEYNPRMFRTLLLNLPVLLLIVASGPSLLPADQNGLSKTGVFTDVTMGLSFKPP